MGLRDILGAFVGALACYGCWRGLAHLMEREVAMHGRLVRYWWPTAMLAWSWFMLWATSFPAASNWLGFAREPLLIAFFGVNLPQAVVGNGVLAVLIDASDAVKGSIASAVVWLFWYGVIRVWAWRLASRASSASMRIAP